MRRYAEVVAQGTRVVGNKQEDKDNKRGRQSVVYTCVGLWWWLVLFAKGRDERCVLAEVKQRSVWCSVLCRD